MAGSGSAVAPPGTVQSAIDDAHDAGGGGVRLDASARYDPAETWHVKPGVVLDCGGAVVAPSEERDVFHVHPSARVSQPRVHLPSVDWGATVFTFDTAYGPYHPIVADGPTPYYGAGVVGGYTTGVEDRERPNRSRVFHVRNRGEGMDCVTWLSCRDHQTYYVGTVYDLHAADPDDTGRWINGNYFGGMHWFHETCLRTRGDGKVNGNTFRIDQAQPDNSREYSTYLWDLRLGDYNTVLGMCWDAHYYDALLSIPESGADAPRGNLVWTQGLDTKVVAEGGLGENYVLTNDSFASLSGVGVETRE